MSRTEQTTARIRTTPTFPEENADFQKGDAQSGAPPQISPTLALLAQLLNTLTAEDRAALAALLAKQPNP